MKRTQTQASTHPTGRFSELTVDRLVIPYPNGKAAIEMQLDLGTPLIRVLNKDGLTRALLSCGKDNVSLDLYACGRVDESVLSIIADDEDGGKILLLPHNFGTATDPRHWLQRLKLTPGALTMTYPVGETAIDLRLNHDEGGGTPEISLNLDNGKPAIKLAVDRQDADNPDMWQAPIVTIGDEDGNATLQSRSLIVEDKKATAYFGLDGDGAPATLKPL